MVIHEIVSEKWGNNLGDQLSASDVYIESKSTNKIVKGIFGQPKIITEMTESYRRSPTDEDCVIREYSHLCGVYECFLSQNKDGRYVVVAVLDGHNACVVDIEDVEFRVGYSYVTSENDGNPLAKLFFQGTGKRRGPLYNCQTNRLILTFSDDGQMFKYLHSVPNQAGK